MGILGCSGLFAFLPLCASTKKDANTQPREALPESAQPHSHTYPYPSAATLAHGSPVRLTVAPTRGYTPAL